MFSQSTASSTAPALTITRWFNSNEPLTLDDFKGQVVVLIAFQMLCPGCVARSIPLAQRLVQTFDPQDVAVVGLHTVFEHHDVMTPDALAVFLAEYRVRFPVGVDAPDQAGGAIPQTMRAYEMQGTPTLVLIDAQGRRRAQYFGAHDELLLGAEIGSLLAERHSAAYSVADDRVADPDGGCRADKCEVPVPPGTD